jgi:hypothetical protein
VKHADRLVLRTLRSLLASLLLWNLPFGGVLLYPFKLLATWLHEMSHGIVMLVTGNGLDRVTIYRDTSGLAHAGGEAGPIALAFIATAGYMGTALWGALLLVVLRPHTRAARCSCSRPARLTTLSSPGGDRFGRSRRLMAGGRGGGDRVAGEAARRRALHRGAGLKQRAARYPRAVPAAPDRQRHRDRRADAHTMALDVWHRREVGRLFWAVTLVWSLVVLYVAPLERPRHSPRTSPRSRPGAAPEVPPSALKALPFCGLVTNPPVLWASGHMSKPGPVSESRRLRPGGALRHGFTRGESDR